MHFRPSTQAHVNAAYARPNIFGLGKKDGGGGGGFLGLGKKSSAAPAGDPDDPFAMWSDPKYAAKQRKEEDKLRKSGYWDTPGHGGMAQIKQEESNWISSFLGEQKQLQQSLLTPRQRKYQAGKYSSQTGAAPAAGGSSTMLLIGGMVVTILAMGGVGLYLILNKDEEEE